LLKDSVVHPPKGALPSGTLNRFGSLLGEWVHRKWKMSKCELHLARLDVFLVQLRHDVARKTSAERALEIRVLDQNGLCDGVSLE
jgi:hypothetical protein